MSFLKTVSNIDFDQTWLLRIFTIIPVVLILVAGGGALWIYFFVQSLLPDSQSLVETPGLSADVRVYRDRTGTPGIVAEREEDAALVLGYVMAQDRLWQMDYLRKAGQGRLAEILGADYIDGDHLIRSLRPTNLAEQELAVLDPRERRWLDRFVLGINRYLVGHAGKLPVEFSLLEYRPTPFTAEDAISICFALAWESSPAARVDPVMVRLVGRLGERARDLMPTDPAATPVSPSGDLIGWTPKGLLFPRPGEVGVLGRVPGLRGGCAWAVGPSRSRSGKPITGSAVYQALSAPAFWYRARISAGDLELAGTFIPGVPAALAGSNAHTGWSAIAAPVDDADLYLERLDPDSPDRCRRIDRWRKIEERKETYRVRGGATVSRMVAATETGPIVSEPEKNMALSLRWTGREGLGLYAAFYRLNRARGAAELGKALAGLRTPAMNVAWVDAQGKYGIRGAGRVPIRPPESDGLLPVPGWTGVHDWVGFISLEEIPSYTNRSADFAVAADGRPGGPGYPLFVSCYWSDSSREERIGKLIEEGTEHHRESFQTILADAESAPARDLTPLIVEGAAAKEGRTAVETEALRILGSWDYRMKSDSQGAAIFGLVYQCLLEDLLLRPLGDSLFEGFTGYAPLSSRTLRRIFIEKEYAWLNGADPGKTLARAFEAGVERGRSLMGSDPKDWRWGDIHETEFRHPLTRRSRFLEALYRVGPIPSSGSADTVSFSNWWPGRPFGVVEGVTLTQVIDMTDPPQSFAMTPLGTSAHFFSANYKDLTGDWIKGRTHRDPVQAADIRKNGFSSILFKAGPSSAVSLSNPAE